MAYQKQTCKVLHMASKLFITPLKGANKQDWHLQNKALATKKTEHFSLGVPKQKRGCGMM